MDNIQYYVIAITLFFVGSILLSFMVIHRKMIMEIVKIVFAHIVWLGLWIPSFFVSVKLALLIPAAWVAYVLIQYERRSLKKIKGQAAKTA
jgi:hypothetical protein